MKQHDYLFCIDSDGTIMDSMTIKHELCFGPAFIEVFNMHEHEKDILTTWNKINLYSTTRGINRFQGLQLILEYIKKTYNITFPGDTYFYDWVNKTPRFDINLLKDEINKIKENYTLKLALEWSFLVNKKISTLPPFNQFSNCKEALIYLNSFADLIGVSSANKDAVLKEWKHVGIINLFNDVFCQDKGSKSDIIKKACELGYEKDKVIMIGDALGDYDAAMANQVHFYPIIPKNESNCWENLRTHADFIKNGLYKNYEPQLINQFLYLLSHGGK